MLIKRPRGLVAEDALEAVGGVATRQPISTGLELIPQIDLLHCTAKTMLGLNGRYVGTADGLSQIVDRLEAGVISRNPLDRQARSRDAAERIVGVGHKAFGGSQTSWESPLAWRLYPQ
jgi:hypothetical protein